MKIFTLLIAIPLVAFSQFTMAQDSLRVRQTSQLLVNYYAIKDALFAGDTKEASSQATAFIKTANTIDYKLISEGKINALLKNATKISENKDISTQRDYFSKLSASMVDLAKSLKLDKQAVYQQYCPMKKASWLSNDREIKNPYYGNAMPNCGEVISTFNP